MKKIYRTSLMIFLSINNIFLLHGMQEQGALELYRQLKFPRDGAVTSVSLDSSLSKCACIIKPNLFSGAMRMNVINSATEETVTTDMQGMGPVEFSCFGKNSNKIGLITQQGKIRTFDCDKRSVEELCNDKRFSAIAFGRDKFFAGNHEGEIFIIGTGNQCKKMFQMPANQSGQLPIIITMACDTPGLNMALAGVNEECAYVIPTNQSNAIATKLYWNGVAYPNTKVSFDGTGLWVAAAAGKMAIVYSLAKNSESSEEDGSFAFEFEKKVTDVVFGPTKDYLFVCLENGSVYLSQSKNAIRPGHPENYSDLLLTVEDTIESLVYCNQTKMLGLATIYYAAIYRFLLTEKE